MELHHWVMSSFVSSVWFMISIMSSIGVLSKVVVNSTLFVEFADMDLIDFF